LSTGRPGGGGICCGLGGLGAAKAKSQHIKASKKQTILFGTILIGRKSKKKISLTKFFIFYFVQSSKNFTKT